MLRHIDAPEVGQTVYALEKSLSTESNRGGAWGKVVKLTSGRVYLASPDGHIRYVRDYEHEFLVDTTAEEEILTRHFGQEGV